jgi:hypothetical protein
MLLLGFKLTAPVPPPEATSRLSVRHARNLALRLEAEAGMGNEKEAAEEEDAPLQAENKKSVWGVASTSTTAPAIYRPLAHPILLAGDALTFPEPSKPRVST